MAGRGIRKSVVLETKNEAESFLTRINAVKNHPDLFQDVQDEDGKHIEASKIKRENELTGAGIEYLTCYGDFVFTHIKETLEIGSKYYTAQEMDWSTFLDIVTGRIKEQRERAEVAIMHYVAKPKQALVIDSEGNYRSAPPFILEFKWHNPGKLDAKQAAKFANLDVDKGKKVVKRDYSPRLPIDKVTVMFYKPLYEGFFLENPSTYSFPMGMYAKIYKASSVLRVEESDNDKRITAFTRLIRYVMRHQNLTGKEKADNNGKLGEFTANIIELLQNVDPSLVQKNGHGNLAVNWKGFDSLIEEAQNIYSQIRNFRYYPMFTSIEKSKFTVIIGIYRTGKAALDAAIQTTK
jgi:SpoVK/Ycf46/Vps4 family AAA+-type ATPase